MEEIEKIYLNWRDTPSLQTNGFGTHYANQMGRKSNAWISDLHRGDEFLQSYKLPKTTLVLPMDDLQENVGSLMRTAGQKCPSVPGFPPYEIRQLREYLIIEEAEELQEAEVNDDLVEVADALVDLLVVVIGMACAYGIRLQPLWDEVQRSNESKFIGGVLRNEAGKYLKGPHFSPPRLLFHLMDQGFEGDATQLTPEEAEELGRRHGRFPQV